MRKGGREEGREEEKKGERFTCQIDEIELAKGGLGGPVRDA